MKPSEAIEFLRRYNEWRRGADMDQPHPRYIGRSIDALCDHAERMERELEQERQDRKQADLDTIRALGERNDARAELERRANARAIHAMTPQERFTLMFQQKPTDDQAGG